jgi:hypothetical protein
MNKSFVRTNHTINLNYNNGGYTPKTNHKGYVSSIIRKKNLRKLIKEIETKDDILKHLFTVNYKDPCNSIYRIGYRCDDNYKYGFATTTQLLMDIKLLTFSIYLDKFNSEFIGVFDERTNKSNFKIKYEIKYNERDEYKHTTLKQLR